MLDLHVGLVRPFVGRVHLLVSLVGFWMHVRLVLGQIDVLKSTYEATKRLSQLGPLTWSLLEWIGDLREPVSLDEEHRRLVRRC